MNFSGQSHNTLVRKGVQTACALFCIYTGWPFYLFYLWALGNSTYTPRPPAVETFLPLSTLMSLEKLVLTSIPDIIHPSGLTIFIAITLYAMLFRRFCGRACPVGLLSGLPEKAVRGLRLEVPGFARPPLPGIKYLLSGFFVWIILVKIDVKAIDSFLHTLYNTQ